MDTLVACLTEYTCQDEITSTYHIDSLQFRTLDFWIYIDISNYCCYYNHHSRIRSIGQVYLLPWSILWESMQVIKKSLSGSWILSGFRLPGNPLWCHPKCFSLHIMVHTVPEKQLQNAESNCRARLLSAKKHPWKVPNSIVAIKTGWWFQPIWN